MRISPIFLLIAIAVSVPNTVFGSDVQTISHGERVDIEAHLAPGKLTLIDFYADWCGPCRSLAPTLERLANQHADRFALRKIDISQAGAPAGAQYGVSAIPHLILFDESGALVREGNAGAVLRELENRLGGSGGRSRSSDGGFPIAPLLLVVLVAVGVVLYLRRGHTAAPAPVQQTAGHGPALAPLAPIEASWFAMIQNSLEGPFTEDDLERMLADRVLPGNARVRRRGDAQWKTLEGVVES